MNIITATYNSYPSIVNCIRCIADQSLKVNHLIIDGSSKDQTLEAIINSPSVSAFISEPDNGLFNALNKGIKMVHDGIIGFLHSDDLLESKNTLQQIAECFAATQADVVYGDLVYVDKYDTAKVIRYWRGRSFKPYLLQQGWMPAHPTVFIKKTVYEKHGLFDLDFKIAADYDLMLRIFSDSELVFVYLPVLITRMRIGGTSNKSLKNIIRKSIEDHRAMKKNGFPFPIGTLLCKNLSKIPQFIMTRRQYSPVERID